MSTTSGGRLSIVIGGVAYSARGEVTLSPSGISVEAGVNQDASLYRTVKPKVKTAACTFDRLKSAAGQVLKWADDMMLLDDLGGTFVEQDTGITHLLSGGFFTGDPEINTATGEVSGVGFAAAKYETI
jgi:Phage tail tube protein